MQHFDEPPAELDVPDPESIASDAAADRLFALSLDPLCLAGTDGCFRRVNPAFTDLLGVPPEALLAVPIVELVHPDDRDATRDVLQRLARGMPVPRIENRFRCGDGSYRWLSWRCTLPDDDGIIYAVARDVTNQRAAEEALLASESLFRGAFEHAGIGMCLSDADGRLTRVNPALCRMLGWAAAELVGRHFLDFTHPDDRPTNEALYRRLVDGEIETFALEKRHLHRTGRVVQTHLHVAAVRDGAGQLRHVLAQMQDITERKAAEEALRRREREYVAVVNNAPDIIARVDRVGRCLFINRAGERMTERRREELLGRAPDELGLPAEPLARWRALLDGAVASGRATEGTLGIPAPDGTRSHHVRMVPERGPDGAIASVLVISRDVTEALRAEQALRKSEERYRQLVEAAHEGIWVTDGIGVTTYLNRRTCEMLGLDASALMGRALFDFMTPDSAFAARTLFARHQRGLAEVHELTFRRGDGSEMIALVSVSPLHDHDGAFTGTLALLTDITARRHAERELEEKAAALESAVEGISRLDASGLYVEVNPAYARMLGYTPDEMVGMLWSATVHPDDLPTLHAAFDTMRRTGKAEAEATGVRKDGSTFRKRLTLVRALGPDGRFAGHRCLMKDITEQLALEAQLRQAQKMEAVGQLAGGVAHDFNNLLTVIQVHTELLGDANRTAEGKREDVDEIRKASTRAASLTRQLLAFSRKQLLRPQVLDLNETVREMEKMIRRLIGEDIEVATLLDPALGPTLADRGQVEQVLINLAVNARDAMPAGGVLTIETANVDVDRRFTGGRPGVHRPGRYVMLAVADTGVGMEPATQARIFEPFFTTKEPGRGTGLGLSTVYGIVKQSGGYVWVESEPGRGSTFRVYLPRHAGDADADASGAAAAHLAAGSETILLVEDEEAVRDLTRKILERLGYTVLEARHGQDALLVAERHGGSIDLVVTDMVMPGINGREMVERLRERRPGTRALFVSGYTDDDIIRRGLLTREMGFLQKPFTSTELARAVRAVLGAARA